MVNNDQLFPKKRGWAAFEGDITTFCKILLRANPTHEQMNYLLRVQNAGPDGVRIGMTDMSANEQFGVIACSTLYRAFVHKTVSFMFYEHKKDATDMVERMRLFILEADPMLRDQVEVSKLRLFLTANKVHICHSVGPWSKDAKFGAGLHDVIILNFDDTPTDRLTKLFEMSRGSIVYLPLTKK